MNYEWIYKQLFEKAKNRNDVFIGERHHFIPTSYTKNIRHINKVRKLTELLGIDYASSHVLLSYREHYVAHLLLFKIFNDHSSMYALNIVINRFEVSRKYENFRRQLREATSKTMKNMVVAYDTATQTTKHVSVQEFKENNRYIGINKALGINKKIFFCEKCNKKIMGKANYDEHVKFYCIHSNESKEKIFKNCKFCNAVVYEKSLGRHESTCKKNHNKINLIYDLKIDKCRYCGKEGHVNIISRHEKFECINNINKINKVSAKKIPCKHCKKEFSTRGIVIHERSCKN